MLVPKHLPERSLLLAIGCCVSFASAADICRVTEQGKADKNGSDWGANATTLQAALKNSHSKNCDEVWVKAGVYKPASSRE